MLRASQLTCGLQRVDTCRVRPEKLYDVALPEFSADCIVLCHGGDDDVTVANLTIVARRTHGTFEFYGRAAIREMGIRPTVTELGMCREFYPRVGDPAPL